MRQEKSKSRSKLPAIDCVNYLIYLQRICVVHFWGCPSLDPSFTKYVQYTSDISRDVMKVVCHVSSAWQMHKFHQLQKIPIDFSSNTLKMNHARNFSWVRHKRVLGGLTWNINGQLLELLISWIGETIEWHHSELLSYFDW